jgi:hypothetical protein
LCKLKQNLILQLSNVDDDDDDDGEEEEELFSVIFISQ